jgi:hypothetical protein
VHKDGVGLWLQMMAAAVDRDSLVVGRALSSVLDLILDVQEAFEVVIVGLGVVGAVPVETDPQIRDSLGDIDCNIVVDYARM